MGDKRDLKHIAIIMDGNGRWAEKHNLPRVEGHRKGAETLKNIVDAVIANGIEYLTVYAFSTENWKRSPKEVMALMSLLGDFAENDLPEIKEKGIRIKAIGDLARIPWITRRKLLRAIKETEDNRKGTLVLALSYGGRAELTEAVAKISRKVQNGELKPQDITEDTVSANLYDPSLPDPDLLIRTSGEQRISNFLLWQLSYAEFYFTDTLWPDFDRNELETAIDHFYRRDRRFGGR